MLPKQYRLKKRIAFNATYRTGISCHIDGITAFCGKKKHNETNTKFGFVVSKKIHKRAVKRNRIKRLMRESLRIEIKKNNTFDTKYISVVFVASTKLLDKNYDYVNKTMQKLIGKLQND